MAEYLIMSEEHWTHRVPEAERANWSPAMWEKFQAAYEKGDIVAVYPDGTLEEGVSNPAFKGIRVKGQAADATLAHEISGDGEQHRRRYCVDVDALVPVKEKVASVTESQFDMRLYDKQAIAEKA